MPSFSPEEMIERFQERAEAVRKRPLPPVAGQERNLFVKQAQIDYQDFAMIGDAVPSFDGKFLVLKIDLRPEKTD